jgi:hypothetical protein
VDTTVVVAHFGAGSDGGGHFDGGGGGGGGGGHALNTLELKSFQWASLMSIETIGKMLGTAGGSGVERLASGEFEE